MSAVAKILREQQVELGEPISDEKLHFPGGIHPLLGDPSKTTRLALVQVAGKVVGIAGVQNGGLPLFALGLTEDSSARTIAPQLAELSQSELEIRDGALIVVRSGARLRVKKLGLEVPLENTAEPVTTSPIFRLPKKLNRPDAANIFSVDDSPGKEKWRRLGLLGQARELFPEGWSTLPETDRHLVCFPGFGKEAEVWLDFGVTPKEMTFVENSQDVIDHLIRSGTPFYGQQFSPQQFLKRKFEAPPNTKGAIEALICKRLPQGHRLSILSIDPNNALNKAFFVRLVEIFKFVPLADRCLVSINFNGGRRQDWSLYEEIYRTVTGQPFTGSREELRAEAIKMAIPAAIKKARREIKLPISITSTISGSYEGNHAGGGSLRLFAIHQLK